MQSKSRFGKIFIRLFAILLFGYFAVMSFQNFSIPRFAFDGWLGISNYFIIVLLMILTIRHFVVLLFASLEQMRIDGLAEPSYYPGISIIVPAYNEGVVIARTIDELGKLDYPGFEVVVVDDGSSDDTFEKALQAAKKYSNVSVFSKRNGGKGNALNFGIGHARHDFVFCMDADSHVAAGALKRGIRHLVDYDVSAVAGSVLVLNQSRYLAGFQALEYLTGLNLYKLAQSNLGLITVIPGPSGLFRKSDILAVGGYQVDTFAEDCDLTLALAVAGKKIVYEPEMEVRTEVPATLMTLIKQRYRWNRGILQSIFKHLGALQNPLSNPPGMLIIGYMILEALLLPFLSLSGTAMALIYTAVFLDFQMISLWFLQLTLIDLTATLFALADLRWSLRLLLFTLVNRFSYAFFLDLIRLASTVEECLGIRMNWGKLERLGEADQ